MASIPTSDEQLRNRWFGIIRCSLPSDLLAFLALVPLGDRSLAQSGPFKAMKRLTTLRREGVMG